MSVYIAYRPSLSETELAPFVRELEVFPAGLAKYYVAHNEIFPHGVIIRRSVAYPVFLPADELPRMRWRCNCVKNVPHGIDQLCFHLQLWKALLAQGYWIEPWQEEQLVYGIFKYQGDPYTFLGELQQEDPEAFGLIKLSHRTWEQEVGFDTSESISMIEYDIDFDLPDPLAFLSPKGTVDFAAAVEGAAASMSEAAETLSKLADATRDHTPIWAAGSKTWEQIGKAFADGMAEGLEQAAEQHTSNAYYYYEVTSRPLAESHAVHSDDGSGKKEPRGLDKLAQDLGVRKRRWK